LKTPKIETELEEDIVTSTQKKLLGNLEDEEQIKVDSMLMPLNIYRR